MDASFTPTRSVGKTDLPDRERTFGLILPANHQLEFVSF